VRTRNDLDYLGVGGRKNGKGRAATARAHDDSTIPSPRARPNPYGPHSIIRGARSEVRTGRMGGGGGGGGGPRSSRVGGDAMSYLGPNGRDAIKHAPRWVPSGKGGKPLSGGQGLTSNTKISSFGRSISAPN
jgi:hypothetical protein